MVVVEQTLLLSLPVPTAPGLHLGARRGLVHGVVAVRAVARAQVGRTALGAEVVGTESVRDPRGLPGAGRGSPQRVSTASYATFAESTKIAADVASFTARDSLRRRGAIANAEGRATRKNIVDTRVLPRIGSTRKTKRKLPLRSRAERFLTGAPSLGEGA